MSNSELTRDVTIVNPRGFHARPAHVFVSLANQFQATIEVSKDGERVDGKSILSILTLGAEKGTQLTLHVRGADAERAIEALGALIDQGFDPDELEEDPGSGEPSGSSSAPATPDSDRES